MKEVQFKDPVSRDLKTINGSQLKIAYRRPKSAAGGSLVQEPFFSEKAEAGMHSGLIPDFNALKESLSTITVSKESTLSAIQFLPALRQFEIKNNEEIENFLRNPETNHVLVQNDSIKIVLIRWEAGASCDIHGHALGGCVFKVLSGEIEEKRYSAAPKQALLSKSSYYQNHIAYIDDVMGLHTVGNPTSVPAVTLHLYTPGNYTGKK